jgi:hypothetical protein
MSSPFTEFQRMLILGAAGVAVLLAGWNLLKAFHPRWHGGERRYASIGLAVLLMVCAAECVAVVYAMSFIRRHPLWLPTLAVAGLTVSFLAGFYDDRRKKSSSPPKVTEQVHSAESDLALIRKAVLCAKVLGVSLGGIVFSLYGQLFGPQWAGIFGVAGFLLAMSVFIFGERHRLGVRFREICPQGLSGAFARLLTLKIGLQRGIKVAALCFIIAMATFVSAVRFVDGVPQGGPVFAPRQRYFLNDHSNLTKVSRLRYCVAGTTFHIAWHAAVVGATLLALHALIFGEIPKNVHGRRAKVPEANAVERPG